MKSAPCIFCEIVAGRSPASIICENDYVMAITPREIEAPGHTLLIPKRHSANLLDIHPDDLNHLLQFTKRLAHYLSQAKEADGFNLLHASGEAAQQSVGHFHMHLIPPQTNDGLNTLPTLPGANSSLHPIVWSNLSMYL